MRYIAVTVLLMLILSGCGGSPVDAAKEGGEEAYDVMSDAVDQISEAVNADPRAENMNGAGQNNTQGSEEIGQAASADDVESSAGVGGEDPNGSDPSAAGMPGGSADPGSAAQDTGGSAAAAQNGTAKETAETGPEAEPEADEIRHMIEAAEKNTDLLTSRQEQCMIYTSYQDGSDESANMKLTVKDAGSTVAKVSSVGSLKVGTEVVDLELYYWDGTLYQVSGNNRLKNSCDYETAINTMDMLYAFRDSMRNASYSELRLEQSADGRRTVSFVFHVAVDELHTSGTGELVINQDNLVAGRSYQMECVTETGNVVRQSVEAHLISWGDKVPEVEFPALELFDN